MFTFVLQENKTDIEIVITKILLAIAGSAAIVYSETYYLISISSAIILLVISYFVKTISSRLKINRSVILLIAAVILLIATHSFIFTGILLAYALLLKYFQKKSEVIITTESIVLKKMFTNEVFTWQDFNNIVLKDGLLTLDFVDNKLLQLSVDEKYGLINPKDFNLFCDKHLLTTP